MFAAQALLPKRDSLPRLGAKYCSKLAWYVHKHSEVLAGAQARSLMYYTCRMHFLHKSKCVQCITCAPANWNLIHQLWNLTSLLFSSCSFNFVLHLTPGKTQIDQVKNEEERTKQRINKPTCRSKLDRHFWPLALSLQELLPWLFKVSCSFSPANDSRPQTIRLDLQVGVDEKRQKVPGIDAYLLWSNKLVLGRMCKESLERKHKEKNCLKSLLNKQ